jgi:hypothetical protein
MKQLKTNLRSRRWLRGSLTIIVTVFIFSSLRPFSERYSDAVLIQEAARLVRDDKQSLFDSNSYWEERYKRGGNSGAGSYGALAEYKAKVVNDFVVTHSIREVAEFGCGDGSNLRLYDKIPHYCGYDVSATVITARQKEWESDTSRQFIHYSGKSTEVKRKYDATMSLDVLYHLVDKNIFISYLDVLFFSASRYVLIYATDEDRRDSGRHVFFRRFNPYIAARFKCWELVKDYGNPGLGSTASFFLYHRRSFCMQV